MTDQNTTAYTAAISAAQEATFAALVEIGCELDKKSYLNAVEFITAWKSILQLGHMTTVRMYEALGKPEEKVYNPQTWGFNLANQYGAADNCPDSETVRRAFIWLALELSATSLSALKDKVTVRSAVISTSVVMKEKLEDVEQAPDSCMPDGRPWNTKLVDDQVYNEIVGVRAKQALQNDCVYTFLDLAKKTEAELLRIKNFGRKGLNEVKRMVERHDIHLGMDID